MPTIINEEQGRTELATLLASGIFSRAPSLALLLTYICEKHFEGQADQIKEYNVAVEALGRPPEFDQKRDSIVRVEVHRLRRRLKEYYEGEGADHPVHILIPSGRYAPMFVVRNPQTDLELLAPSTAIDVPPAHVATVHYRKAGFRPWAVFALILLAAAAIGAIAARNWPTRAERHDAGRSGSSLGTVEPLAGQIRIQAGASQPYIDRFGQSWEADRWFEGGTVASDVNHRIFGTRDPKLYQSRREGAFQYRIPLKPGRYELRLHVAETIFGDTNIAGGGETSRLFNVRLNGATVWENADVIADAGPNTADIRVFKDVRPAPDGYLHIDFQPSTNGAIVSGIEITPGTPGRLRPIRIVTRDQSYT